MMTFVEGSADQSIISCNTSIRSAVDLALQAHNVAVDDCDSVNDPRLALLERNERNGASERIYRVIVHLIDGDQRDDASGRFNPANSDDVT